MAKQLTLRGVSSELAQRLRKLADQRGESVNTTALAILERATGIDARRARLARYTTWSEEDVEEISSAVRAQRTIDPALWT